MNYENYFIPTNFTDAGRVFGLFEMRNLVEAVILTVHVIYLCFVLLPFRLTAKLIVTLTIAVPVGGFSLIGIGGDRFRTDLPFPSPFRQRRDQEGGQRQAQQLGPDGLEGWEIVVSDLGADQQKRAPSGG